MEQPQSLQPWINLVWDLGQECPHLPCSQGTIPLASKLPGAIKSASVSPVGPVPMKSWSPANPCPQQSLLVSQAPSSWTQAEPPTGCQGWCPAGHLRSAPGEKTVPVFTFTEGSWNAARRRRQGPVRQLASSAGTRAALCLQRSGHRSRRAIAGLCSLPRLPAALHVGYGTLLVTQSSWSQPPPVPAGVGKGTRDGSLPAWHLSDARI